MYERPSLLKGLVMRFTATIRTVLLCSIALAISCDNPSGPVLGPEIAPKQPPLVGRTAPDIEAKLLDDSPFSLKSHASEVVLLDFWATWCGPCVMELPILMKIAEEYKSKGVVLYAVNAGEDAETIRAFLKDRQWEFNVVLDADGKSAIAYEVTGIPQLVIIGRNGIVKAVHVGYSDDLEHELRAELDSLVAQ